MNHKKRKAGNDALLDQKNAAGSTIEVADVVRLYGKNYHPVTSTQKKILFNVEHCRTVAMGGHSSQCDRCHHVEISYNSCRDRHCPKCQALNKAKWLAARESDLLPVGCFHVVFTLPHEVNPLVLNNKKVLLNTLFKSVKETLFTFAGDSKHKLQGQLGITAVLHTWDQKLNPHYHLHCLIPGGVFSKEDQRWVPAKNTFLFPVKALSEVFKGKYVSQLRKAYKNQDLLFPHSIKALKKKETFAALLSGLMEKKWVVYAKRPFKSPRHVFDYLGRYTHRVAISNHRVLALEKGKVFFSYRDRKQTYAPRVCELPAETFIKRFLYHELPSGFMKIRHFGFLGNARKKATLAVIRRLLNDTTPKRDRKKQSTAELMVELTGIDIFSCPNCKEGKLKLLNEFDGIFKKSHRPLLLTPV